MSTFGDRMLREHAREVGLAPDFRGLSRRRSGLMRRALQHQLRKGEWLLAAGQA